MYLSLPSVQIPTGQYIWHFPPCMFCNEVLVINQVPPAEESQPDIYRSRPQTKNIFLIQRIFISKAYISKTGYPGVWSKQTRLVGVRGRERYQAILPLCIVYTIPQHKETLCVKSWTEPFLFKSLCLRPPEARGNVENWQNIGVYYCQWSYIRVYIEGHGGLSETGQRWIIYRYGPYIYI